MSGKRVILNIVAFQGLWWLCVVGGSHGMAMLALGTVLVYAVWHVCRVEQPVAALPLVLCSVLGMMSDQWLYRSGLVVFPGFAGAWIPFWMMGLWLAFATTLNVSLRWLQNKLWLSSLLGVVFAPPTYWGAQSLGAVQFPQLSHGLLAVAVAWGVLMPAMLWIRRKL